MNLLYFGKRYYDPVFGRWISIDPVGFEDSLNLYQYVKNNPFKFVDPYGENLLGWCLGVGEMLLGGTLMVTGAFIEIGSFGTLTFAVGIQEAAGLSLIGHGFSQAMIHSRDISFPRINKDIIKPGNEPIFPNEIETIPKVPKLPNKEKPVGHTDLFPPKKKPPYSGDELGNDPTKSPGKEFEWRGSGEPESGKGSWINDKSIQKKFTPLYVHTFKR